MLIKDLKDLCYSCHSSIQMCILYDYNSNTDVDKGSVEYIIKHYSDLELTRIQSYNDNLIFEVRL